MGNYGRIMGNNANYGGIMGKLDVNLCVAGCWLFVLVRWPLDSIDMSDFHPHDNVLYVQPSYLYKAHPPVPTDRVLVVPQKGA